MGELPQVVGALVFLLIPGEHRAGHTDRSPHRVSWT